MKLCVLVIFTLTALSPGMAQSQSGSTQSQDERIVVGTSEVVLDAVVKDKKGRPVKDLNANDFEVYEDGLRQQVTSFRLVSREAPNNAASPNGTNQPSQATKSSPVSRENRIGAIALVFDRLSPDARGRAHTAALTYINNGLTADDFVGVFSIDQRLRVVQSFTNDVLLARRGVDAAGSLSSSAFSSTAGQVRDLNTQMQNNQNAMDAAQATLAASGATGNGQSQTQATAAIGANAADQQLAQMTARSLETFERLERDQQGYATTNGLLALVNSMRSISGRKAIIFFSEGIAIPPAVQKQFRAVISNANRANVSIYAVDAAGLRAESMTAGTRDEMISRGQRRLNQVASGRDYTSGPISRELERNEDLLYLNPESGLGQLADETGGFLVSGSNDIGSRLGQVDEDLHSYYLLSYVPKNSNYDGRFRQISVKLNRSGLDVQARKGYYAINAADSSPVLSYEVPALAALSGGTAAKAFPLHIGVFNFPEASNLSHTAVLIEAPHDAVSYVTDAKTKTYRTDFSIVALIKNESQQVIGKLSNQYLLSGPLERLNSAQRGDILFFRTTELPPGRYTLTAAGYDANNQKAGTGNFSFEIKDTNQDKLRLGSLVILKRVEKLASAQKTTNPFQLGEVLVYPNLGEPLRKSVDKQLGFYVTVYEPRGKKEGATPPKLTIELLQQQRSLGRATLDMPAPDADGRIQFASALPITQLQPGDYELRATVDDGTTAGVASSERFTLQP